MYFVARCVGVVVGIDKRPSASVAVLEGTKLAPRVIELFSMTTSETELVDQLHDLAQVFGNRLAGLGVERVVVRRADNPPRPSNKEGPKTRLLVEGALASVARRHVSHTRLMNGRDLAAYAGGGRNKAALDAEAGNLIGEPGHAASVAAALAVLDD